MHPVGFCTLALVASLGSSMASAAPPSDVSPRPGPVPAIELRVEASAVDDSARLAEFVRETLSPHLMDAGYAVYPVDADAQLVVRVRLEPLEVGERNYGLHFEFIEDDRATPAIAWIDCVFCTQYRLETKLDEAAPELVQAIDERAAATTEPRPAEPAHTPPPTPEPRPTDSTAPAPVGPLGIAGVVVAATGVGVSIAGAIELSRGVVVGDGTDFERTRTDRRPLGAALLGAGGTAALVGVALLATDLVRRAPPRSARATVVPLVSPRFTGVALLGQF